MPRETVFVSSPQGRLEAWVYLPSTSSSTSSRHAVVVMGCGVGAVKAAGLHPFASAFCEAGYAAVAFDYMTFGGSDGQPRHLVDVSAEYRDFKAIITWVKQHDRFDPCRIVAWGTSFGGMHVTRLLSEDHTIAAGIAQCPCVDAYLAARLKPFQDNIQLTLLGLWDWIMSLFSSSPIYIQAATTPSHTGLALMNAFDVKDGWQLLHRNLKGGDVDPYSNRIVARSVLWFPFHRPALNASSITAPYLIVVPAFDSVAPRRAAVKVAQIARNGELHCVSGGHFDLYEGGVGYESNLRAQLQFLKRLVC